MPVHQIQTCYGHELGGQQSSIDKAIATRSHLCPHLHSETPHQKNSEYPDTEIQLHPQMPHYSWFQKRQNKALSEALEKIIAELMLLGFISLLITVGTRAILKICIPEKYEKLMLPCKNDYAGDSYEDENGGKGGDGDDGGDNKRKLLSFAGNLAIHRVLAAAAAGGDYCSDGKASLISQTGLHQLHIFIFVLAIFHVLYSVVTMALAQAKMKKWKAWEEETSSLEYRFTNDPTRFRLARQTSFVRRHSGISAAPGDQMDYLKAEYVSSPAAN
ncbi:MLO-LIKE PROTEIN [Salix viminalis]|uniref:MLO-LIKE PROTEIN n=1 Tax=Salix viminalis TaxID=40686 RepID=A0A9Q0ZE98_SALVM|nr:MLO-LIKE PROTEIN [Salix viminalis]